ncbi:MAG: hypothetical protein IBX45_08490 [Campylobacterales bacterium]|nr:hypothetical protein [Campylobacterales bacterium]
MRMILGLVLVVFLSGCGFQKATFFEEKVRVVNPSSVSVAQQEVPKVATAPAHGYIKGIIRKVTQDAQSGLWQYEVEGTDMSNAKLSEARFTHTAPLAGVGALVYAHIGQGKLVQLYALEGAPVPQFASQTPKKVPQKTPKRTLDRQVFSVPQSEVITLE